MENKITTNNESDIVTPPNILIKLSAAKRLKFLSNKDKAVLFENIFNYHTGEKLVEMSPMAQMFFLDLEDVFKFNRTKYAAIIERNKANGKKNKKNATGSHSHPVANSGLPNEHKDKGIDIVKEKGKDKSRTKEIVEEKAPVNSSTKVKPSIKEIAEQFKKIVDIDFKEIKDPEERQFCYDVNTLVNELGWDRFDYLIYSADLKQVPVILEEYSMSKLLNKIQDVKCGYTFYLNSILNKPQPFGE